jgi:hypothetical protein
LIPWKKEATVQVSDTTKVEIEPKVGSIKKRTKKDKSCKEYEE